jgi:hypothetical protein
MPQWDVEVANVFYIRLDADTEDEGKRLALYRITGQGGHEQRIVKITQLEDDKSWWPMPSISRASAGPIS